MKLADTFVLNSRTSIGYCATLSEDILSGLFGLMTSTDICPKNDDVTNSATFGLITSTAS